MDSSTRQQRETPRLRRRELLTAGGAAIAGGGFLAGPAGATGSATATSDNVAAVQSEFLLYHRARYNNVDLESLGFTISWVFGGGCTMDPSDPDYDPKRDWTDDFDRGEAPPSEDLIDFLRSRDFPAASPYVFDIECLFLTGGNRANMETRRDIWVDMLTVAENEFPGKPIGAWNLDQKIRLPDYLDLAQDIAAHLTVFFPNLYTRPNAQGEPDMAEWQNRLNQVVTTTAQIDPSKPVVPFIWPQLWDGSEGGGPFLPPDVWRSELDALLDAGMDGITIWSANSVPCNSDPDDPCPTAWFDETAGFLDTVAAG